MTSKNKAHRATTIKDKATVVNTDQPQHLESSNILLDSIQENFIAQSSTLSTITRATTGVILGAILAICYKEQKIEIPNIWLLLSFIASMIFLVVELLHYLVDSIFYHSKSDEIVEGDENTDFDKIYDEVQRHSKYSFYFLISKAIIVLSLCVIFVIGIFKMYLCYN